MEMNYSDYMQYVSSILKEGKIRRSVQEARTFGKFTKSEQGQWVPVNYAGYTCITPVPESKQENDTSFLIHKAQQELLRGLNPAKSVPAPADALHMTIARLVSGDVFADGIMNKHEMKFITAASRLFSHISVAGPLQFTIKGMIVSEHGVIMAMVAPRSEDDYLCLQSFRDDIYNDKVLSNFGVERKRSFKGHITLAYIEEELTAGEKDRLAELIIDINKRYFLESVPYPIIRAEVRKFRNFLRFYRGDYWPAYHFA